MAKMINYLILVFVPAVFLATIADLLASHFTFYEIPIYASFMIGCAILGGRVLKSFENTPALSERIMSVPEFISTMAVTFGFRRS
jgi:hypothetical protein